MVRSSVGIHPSVKRSVCSSICPVTFSHPSFLQPQFVSFSCYFLHSNYSYLISLFLSIFMLSVKSVNTPSIHPLAKPSLRRLISASRLYLDARLLCAVQCTHSFIPATLVMSYPFARPLRLYSMHSSICIIPMTCFCAFCQALKVQHTVASAKSFKLRYEKPKTGSARLFPKTVKFDLEIGSPQGDPKSRTQSVTMRLTKGRELLISLVVAVEIV